MNAPIDHKILWRMKRRSANDRFDDLTKKNTISGCWLWTGCVGPTGYGMFKVKKTTVRAHRFSYERFRGTIPNGLSIDHLCCVRNCVNPNHLDVVTHQENMRRSKFVARGENNGKSKLTAQEVRQIRILYNNGNGQSRASLARQYGVAHNTIRSIFTGRTWSHL